MSTPKQIDQEALCEQIAHQYRCVTHLCNAIATVHRETEGSIRSFPPGMLDDLGRRSAGIMETLGDILNGMGANDDAEDAWTHPVFKEAQRRWPTP